LCQRHKIETITLGAALVAEAKKILFVLIFSALGKTINFFLNYFANGRAKCNLLEVI